MEKAKTANLEVIIIITFYICHPIIMQWYAARC